MSAWIRIFTAFNVPNHEQDVIRTQNLNQVAEKEKRTFKSIIFKTIFNNFAMESARTFLVEYNKIPDKSNIGINFDDISTIYNDLEKLITTNSTGHGKTTTKYTTVEQKQQAIIDTY